MGWPPTEETLSALASTAIESDAFANSSKAKTTALCYLDGWADGQRIIIFDPVHFANTRFVRRCYTHPENGRELELIVGEED